MADELDVEKGTLKIGVKTFIAILLGLGTASVGGVTTWAQMATKDDVVNALAAHQSTADSHKEHAKTKQTVAKTRTAATRAVTELAHLKKDVDAVSEDVDRVVGRIDFLIEMQIDEGRRNPDARARTRRAASRVRRNVSPGDEDPLAGLDF